MQLIRGMHNIKPEHRACVATIGNFDGVHLGHKTILEALRKRADQQGVRLCVITFEPQPREFFQGSRAPARVTNLREKLVLLEEAGVDQVLCLPFTERLQSLTPDDFVMKVLVDGLDIRFLIVGDDFRYGLNRAGNYAHLKAMGEQRGFEVCDTRTVIMDAGRISSTRVRECLAQDDLDGAEALLGRPFTMMGKVISGQKLGRKLGFPTANIRVNRKALPVKGVFAVRARINGATYNGVANLGTRPTVEAENPLLEVHLLDHKSDLYGQVLRVEFIEKIRSEKKFNSLDELKAAIAADIKVARTTLTT
ncbi:bifunctional riboflavin kinase/FAD synthetase [Endozoicomonas sp. OPT23]|uniref:bifunctional riboflavin kinase/FAD synthetase n=1 Tax=Endozoicomonas sp. OPT23 TaxID=2072845 RepID=UPI00129BF8E4|nr:bifunctional riboflavin kinase/FAD synthetase [Endozoicomonas sp. OPT23]MRI33730.1 bifunctional riboflavin kinase/FAD synthetase [Endozoicomonas sp. OPT23]